MMVSRVWAEHGLQPHRLERLRGLQRSGLRAKAADVIGLYLNPPAHAAVFCVDEKTAIQALDRTRSGVAAVAGPRRTPRVRVLPPRHALALRRPRHRHRRRGGQDGGAAYQRVRGLPGRQVVDQPSGGRSTSSATTSPRTRPTASRVPRRASQRSLHFTPTYSSWLNQVELWFAKIERDVIARGIFTSIPDLAQADAVHPALQQGAARP